MQRSDALYFFQPALLVLILFSLIVPDLLPLSKRSCVYYGVLFLLVLCFSAIGEWAMENATLFPAALLLLIGTMAKVRSHWERILLSSLFGGIAAWKIADLFPLFFEPALLSGLALTVFVMLYCRGMEERFCACALGGLAYEFSFCLQEYFLFTYCKIRFGSLDGLSISAMSLCVVMGVGILHSFRLSKKNATWAFFKPSQKK